MSKLEVAGETSVRIEGYMQDGVFIQQDRSTINIPTSDGAALGIAMTGRGSKEYAELIKRVFNSYYHNLIDKTTL